ncbi:MAG TPA: hypothetical protein VK661_08075 [Planctomycetota bacterium]|jgi:Tfp pilus assembly protein PilX|nr:hypothetical protein [Planctomycetota bacterium]
MKIRKSERGSALILAVIVTLVVAGMSGAYLTLSVSKQESAYSEYRREKAFYAAEAALAWGIHELNCNRDYDGNGLGTTSLTGINEITSCNVTVDTTGLTGQQKRLTAVCVYGTGNATTDRSIEVVYDRPVTAVQTLGLAAIISRDPIDFNGNVTVSGQDYDISDGSVVGAGVDGVLSGGAVTVGGSSTIGGNGIAPPGNGAAPGSIDQNHDWGTDGLDNDRNGTVDQPGETFPSDPDQALGFPAGTLKAAAQSMGTYYTNQLAYTAAIALNGNRMLSGKIIYLEFDPAPPFEMGNGYNVDPSILVIHTATSNATVDNLHGDFKGLLFADKVDHVNSGTHILGMVQAWGQFGNVFGNGNSTIHFSSAVLANLPSVTINPNYARRSYREVNR